jgi:hypothetical protein
LKCLKAGDLQTSLSCPEDVLQAIAKFAPPHQFSPATLRACRSNAMLDRFHPID